MSSSVTAATKITTKRGSHDGATVDKVPLYHLIVTPILFVSFLISLAWVDFRYSVLRSKTNSRESRLPAWLHNAVYRPCAARGQGNSKGKRSTGGPQDGYYHSNQKKLAEMEMADAFEVRGTVIMLLLATSAALSWGLWAVSRRVWEMAMLRRD